MKSKKLIALLLAAALALSALGGCQRVDADPAPQTTAPPTTQAPTTTTAPQTTAPPTTAEETTLPDPVVLQRFEPWLERNQDFVGWVTVPGTKIDYPVVYCEDNTYYLKHDIDKNPHDDGTVFLTMEADLLEKNQSWALFGHHRNNGLMFSDLHKYKKLDFYRQSPVFTFDSLYQEAQYKIFAVFYMAQNQSDRYFYYYPTPSFETEEGFLHHVEQMRVRSIFDIPVDVEWGDQIVVMTCCTYETERLSIAVAGRRVRQGEDTAVDTEAAQPSANPLYPKKWYDKYGGTPPVLSWLDS